MLLFSAVVYLLQGFINAEVARSAMFSRETSISLPLPQECVCLDSRSKWDIIWSCLVTIFACSWVSVHPNIPGPGERWWKKGLRRLELMFWSIISPELIIFWASRQWLAARHLARKYKNFGWTKTHGYYIQMGGFMLYDKEKAIGVLDPEKLEDLLEKKEIAMPKITEDELNDRSKGDGLSKAVVIIQTTWFIAQCITRGAQGLVITQLELVTLALAALNAIMYAFWWNKPLDVETTVSVYLLHATPPQPSILSSPIEGIPVEIGTIPHGDGSIGNGSKTRGSSIELESWIPSSDTPTHQGDKSADSPNLASQVWRILSGILFRWPAAGIVAVVRRVHDIFNVFKQTNSVGEGELRVNTFYVYDGPLIGTQAGVSLVYALPVISALFGAIHCAGWNFPFPSPIEATIWRVSSTFVAGVPVIIMAGIVVAQRFGLERHNEGGILVRSIFVGVTSLVHATLPLYGFARLALLTEALISLRNLSPGALAVVEWTSFIPHV